MPTEPQRPAVKIRCPIVSRLLLTICALSLAQSASAQVDVIEDVETGRRERLLRIERAIRKAAKEAQARRPLETKEDVTYEEILADPDNIDLNFRFAKAQVNRGNLVGASATLERILMIRPDLGSIRHFYALVLYRLDSLEEAKRELERASEASLTEAQRRQVDAYLRDIRKRQRRTKLTASSSLGWGFDTNRNASPSSKRRLLSDAPVVLTGTSRKRRDTNLLSVTSLQITHDLRHQAGHQLIGSLTYFLGEQTAADDLDLQSFSVEGGAVFNTPLATITPTGFANYVYLSRETFQRSQGVKMKVERELGERIGLSASGSWTREEFDPIVENASAPERDGDRINVTVGTQYTLTPSMQLSIEGAYENKDVDDLQQSNAYQGGKLTGSHTWLLGKGQFLLSGITYTRNSYDHPDVSISAAKRRDTQLRGRISYGAPVSLLFGEWLPADILENLTATFSTEHLRSISNITNYTYSNTKLSMMLTKRVEF